MPFDFEKLSVLVVEDTLPMLRLVEAVLETLGVGKIYCATGGEEGFRIFQSEAPDIVLVDWHMEPMHGPDLVREIRLNPSSRNRMVPIIMLTGYNAQPRITLARDIGVTEYLAKPFSAEDLARRVAYVINRPRDFIDNSPDFFGPDRRRIKHAAYKGPKKRKADKLMSA